MKLGIFYNETQTESKNADRLAGLIEKKGGKARIFSRISEIADIDRLIVLGGDGTVLRVAKRASDMNIPLVGVNYGTLGFLAEFERGEDEKAVDLAMGDCPVVERSMLEVDLDGKTSYCLNELSLLRPVNIESPSGVVGISVEIDGSKAADFTADGLIVATPTGSTAYSLSAGGCIMTPDSETFILTPVCAFSLRSRPIVFPDSCALTVTVRDKTLMLYGDGDYLGQINGGRKIKIRKAMRTARFLTADPNGYFLRLAEKINR